MKGRFRVPPPPPLVPVVVAAVVVVTGGCGCLVGASKAEAEAVT